MCDALITKAESNVAERAAVTATAAVGGISQLWSYANSASECEISPDKRREKARGGLVQPRTEAEG